MKRGQIAGALAALLVLLRLLLPGTAARAADALRAALAGEGSRERVEALGRSVAQGGP